MPSTHLKLLRSIMGCPVQLGGTQQGHIILLLQILHQVRNELLSRQTAKTAVFWGQNDLESPVR